MLITGAQRLSGEPVAVRITDRRLTNVAVHLEPGDDEPVLDLRGGTLLPGLHDHHLHLRAAVAALQSVSVGPQQVATPQQLAEALGRSRPRDDGSIRAVGYHDSVAGELDRHRLDELFARAPVRIQHRSGAMWIVNTPGLIALGWPDHPTGRFFRQDNTFAAVTADGPTDFTPLGVRLARFGVTGITEATPDLGAADLDALDTAVREERLPQRVMVMSQHGGRHYSRLEFGPVKRILDDSTLDLDELTSWVAERHEHGYAVALHCVTVVQLVVTLSAFRSAGVRAGDRIEHAAMVPDDVIDDLADLGVTVVTQPNFVAERGDEYLREVPPAEHHELWRVAGLRRSGVPIAGSTDAPFGDLDPWAAMRAARDRRTRSGKLLCPDERVGAAAALAMFLGDLHTPANTRDLRTGDRADLCLMSAGPDDVLAELSADLVAATVVDGHLRYAAS